MNRNIDIKIHSALQDYTLYVCCAVLFASWRYQLQDVIKTSDYGHEGNLGPERVLDLSSWADLSVWSER